jgi:hypothetical protein
VCYSILYYPTLFYPILCVGHHGGPTGDPRGLPGGDTLDVQPYPNRTPTEAYRALHGPPSPPGDPPRGSHERIPGFTRSDLLRGPSGDPPTRGLPQGDPPKDPSLTVIPNRSPKPEGMPRVVPRDVPCFINSPSPRARPSATYSIMNPKIFQFSRDDRIPPGYPWKGSPKAPPRGSLGGSPGGICVGVPVGGFPWNPALGVPHTGKGARGVRGGTQPLGACPGWSRGGVGKLKCSLEQL